jgi:predicted nucleic acid-binding protein
MRVLLDTNVVLDFVLKRQLFFAEADKIFLRLKTMNLKRSFRQLRQSMFFTQRAKK